MKRRYLAVSIDSRETFSRDEIFDAVSGAVVKLFGEYGASQAGLSLIDYDGVNKLVVLRTWLLALDTTRAALASITRIQNKPAALHVLEVSGTIRALHRRLEGA